MGAAPRRCDAVIFDIDGLLLDTEESWTRAERALFERRGREFTAEHKRRLLGSSPRAVAVMLEEMLEEPGRGGALVVELGLLVFEAMELYAPPRPGALDLLAVVHGAGIPMALASNSPGLLVDAALASAGLDRELFAAILSSDAVEHAKPAPDLYLAACRELASDPARTLALEDSPTGVASAVAAGCYTIGVPSIEGVELEQAALVVGSLGAVEIRQALGL